MSDVTTGAFASSASDSELQYLGHAGFVLRAGETTMVFDPWFYPAFAESWFPYPDNRHLLPGLLADPVDYLYVSHTHADHFDRTTLAAMNKDLTVLCPDFRSRTLEREMRTLGFERIVRLGHAERFTVAPGIAVEMILDTSHKEDSGLLVDVHGFRFLNLNDCHGRLGDLPCGIDLLASSFSGASWYPDCYEYAPDVAQAKVASAKVNQIATLARIAEVTQARWYLPSAGPACFLDPKLQHLNDRNQTTFVPWEDVEAFFTSARPNTGVVRMAPGQRIALTPKALNSLPRPAPRTDALPPDLGAYAETRRDEWDIDRYYQAVTTAELFLHFDRLVRRNGELVSSIDADFMIKVRSSGWKVHIGGGRDLEVRPTGPDETAPYVLSLPGWLLRQIVDGRLDWEEGLLTMRISLRRDPDVFDSRLFGLLRYGNQPAQTRQLVLDNLNIDEMVQRDGLQHQRYCPHAGEDLRLASVSGGVIECPRHHWKWDARTGTCLSGGSLPLRVAAIEGEQTAGCDENGDQAVSSTELPGGDQLVASSLSVS